MKNIDSEGAYRVYSYRWVVLAIYGLSTAVIQLMWTTFFSITTQAWQYYGFTDAQEGENAISLLSIIFMAGMIVLSIPVMAAFEKYGFKKAVGFGVVLTGICAIVRGVFGDSYTAVLVATVGFAVAQPFLLNSPGLVAGKWFPENERATANSVGLLCSYVGMCLGLLLTPVMLDAGMTIKGMLTAYGVLGVVTAVLFVAFVKEKPPTPPCAEEDAVRGDAVDSTQVGILGVVILVSGIIGSVIISMVSDKDRLQRRLPYAIGANVIGTVGLVVFIFAGNFTMMLIASLLYGIFIVGAAPLTLTFAAEASFPTSEGTSEGLLMWAGNVAGVIFLGAASLFGSNKAVMIALVAVTVLYLIPMFMAKETKLQKK